MRLEKAETKIAVANDLGHKIEDVKEAAEKEALRWEGSVSAFSQASKACEALGEHVDKDVAEGVFDLEVAKHVKRYVERAANASRNLMAQAENNRISTLGKVTALDVTVKIVAKYRDEETSKVDALKAALAAGTAKIEEDGGAVSIATRPHVSVKERRLAETMAESVTETVKPKRGRPRKHVANA